MKYKEYVGKLNKYLEENPESGELEVIYSSDDEGNAYHKVHSGPDMAQAEDAEAYHIDLYGYYDEDGEDNISKEECNVICIN